MDNVTKEYIEQHAPDMSTIKNARSLSSKGSFVEHGKNEEEDVFFANCTGSGKNPYKVSVDFLTANQPIFRCSCPSRKLPCKHSIGLLEEILKGASFPVSPVPEDILSKRAKQEKRVENAKVRAEEEAAGIVKPPKKVNKAARLKKMQKQLEGIAIVETLINEILTKGISNVETQSKKYFTDLAKEMGNYYLTGPQNYIYQLVDAIEKVSYQTKEKDYQPVFDVLVRMNALVKKSKDYLNTAVAEDNAENQDNEMYEYLGGAWKLEELNALGLKKENPELIQLALYVETSNATKQYTDIGYFYDLETGAINPTMNYRPFKASKYIEKSEVMFDVVSPAILTYYPGEINQRIRWSMYKERPVAPEDIGKIKGSDIGTAVKSAKNYLKNPLSRSKFPACIKYKNLGTNPDGVFIAEDESGTQIRLLPSSNLKNLPNDDLYQNQILFGEIMSTGGEMVFKPRSVISSTQVIAL